jgi:hypothetical protein
MANPVIRETSVVIEPGRQTSPWLRSVLIDVIANRPNAIAYGKGWFWASDEKVLYLSDGSAWQKIAVVEYEDLTGFPKIEQGLHANRPAPTVGNAGRLYYSTDFNGGQLQINTVGGTWALAAPGLSHAGTHADGGSDEIIAQMDSRAYPISAGTLAARPAAAVGDALYYATDVAVLYRSNSVSWVVIAAAPLSDLLANRPAASANLFGKLFFATDTQQLFLGIAGPAWLQIASIGGAGAGELQMDSRVLAANFTINANKSVCVAGPFEISSGVTLEIAAGGILEVH